MKKLAGFFLLLLPAFLAAQNFAGDWGGHLVLINSKLKVIFHVKAEGSGYKSTMDSPDQAALGIEMTGTRVKGDSIWIEMTDMKMVYAGKLADSIITGNFIQAGEIFPLDLRREKNARPAFSRPQEPKRPYPYFEKEITFENKKAGIKLAGTITAPAKKGKFPFVVLVSGSGPQNRNEELLGHKPFLVLADYLTRNGIGVLRFDDRGVAKSEGDFDTATSADFATDAMAAVDFLKKYKLADVSRIGVGGHSEGGVIAPMVAAERPDVAFIVLLAGTGMPGDELLVMQQELISLASGLSRSEVDSIVPLNKGGFDIVKNSPTTEGLEEKLKQYFHDNFSNYPKASLQGMDENTFVNQTAPILASDWFHYFIRLDPRIALRKVKCPVLAVNGEKDLQVPPKENLSGIRKALEEGGNANVKTIEFPGLNHLFQHCTTGAPGEYMLIEETFSEEVMKTVADWIKAQPALK